MVEYASLCLLPLTVDTSETYALDPYQKMSTVQRANLGSKFY